MSNGKLALTPDELGQMFDPKDPQALKRLGGPDGFARSIGTDPLGGIPTDGGTESRLRKDFGANILPPAAEQTLLSMILEALSDGTLIMLCAGAFVSLALGYATHTEEENGTWYIEGTAILFAVAVVVGVTALNDYQKEQQFRKLNAKKNARAVKCMRGGNPTQVMVDDIVVGDVIVLETGDIACADGLVTESSSLKIDESSATGESDALLKTKQGDAFVLSGTHVLEGQGRMVVAAVGPRSYEGRTMLSLRVAPEVTPLEAKLAHLAERIGRLGLASAVVVLVVLVARYLVSMPQDQPLLGAATMHAMVGFFVSAITLVVVAVPEGLPLSVTIALAYSMLQMLKDNNLVRHLAACETMGSATAVLTDKTGTLTQNRMAVVRGRIAGVDLKTSGAGSEQDAEAVRAALRSEDVRSLLIEAVDVNSTAYYDTEGKAFIGSKTEAALLGLSSLAGGSYAESRERAQVEHTYPFSSKVKQMSTVVRVGGGKKKGGVVNFRVHVKGASEIVAARCKQMLGPDGDAIDITDARRAEIDSLINSYASAALRTIGIAYVDLPAKRDWEGNPPDDVPLVLIGIVGIEDPLRPEVPDAVAQCARAGIVVRMVTGDNAVTGGSIAKQCGIYDPARGHTVLEGPAFRKLSDAELDQVIPRLRVLARSSPADKQRLVGRLQQLGEIVAVTGDGTNDAPALRLANVGFAMGITGTAVAREAADIVLMDDNFASIVRACAWGRNVLESIQKFLQMQLTANICAVIVSVVGALVDGPSGADGPPLSPTQMLFVNVIMDSGAALALATDPPKRGLLDRRPRGRAAPLVTRKMAVNIAVAVGLQLAVLLTLLYDPARLGVPARGDPTHGTVFFNCFVLMSLGNEIASRSITEVNVFAGMHRNPIFLSVLAATAAAQYLFVEYGGAFTSTVPLSSDHWALGLACGGLALVVGALSHAVPVGGASESDAGMARLEDASAAKGRRSAEIRHPAVPGSVVDGSVLPKTLMPPRRELPPPTPLLSTFRRPPTFRTVVQGTMAFGIFSSARKGKKE